MAAVAGATITEDAVVGAVVMVSLGGVVAVVVVVGRGGEARGAAGIRCRGVWGRG